jgi:hypothetical protein
VAKFVATDYRITINGTDFSSSLAAATLDISAAEQEVTAFGDTFVQRIAGLKDASISLDFHQDFGAASVDATLFPLLGSQATVVITPTNGNGEHLTRIQRSFLVHRVPALRFLSG